MLLVVRGLRQVDQRRRVHVDVVEPRVDGFASELLHRVHFGVTVDRVLLRIDLEMVTLDEHRPAESFSQGSGDHHRDVFGRALLGVRDFRTRDLEDERTRVQLVGNAENRAGGVVRHAAHVDRRHRETAHRSSASREVQLMDG
jgi:hypothetical protein